MSKLFKVQPRVGSLQITDFDFNIWLTLNVHPITHLNWNYQQKKRLFWKKEPKQTGSL